MAAVKTLLSLVLLAACGGTPTPVPPRDDCGYVEETDCEAVAMGPAEAFASSSLVASVRVSAVDPARFNTPSGEPPEDELDPELQPEDRLDAAIEALFADIDADDAEAEQQASATADALYEAFDADWRENHPFEIGHLLVLEIDDAPGVLRGPPELRWLVSFVRGGRIVVEQGIHAGCVFEQRECARVDPEAGDAGLALAAPFDPQLSNAWHGIARCEARARALEAETGQPAACMALEWLLPGAQEAGWRWSGGIGDGLLGIDLIREMLPRSASAGRPGAQPAAGPPGYAELVEAFAAGDELRRDAILRAWHEQVQPIGPLERASLPLAHRRAYGVTERFYADLLPRLRDPDRYLVVQPGLKIEGHGPPGNEIIERFRPHLPPGPAPIYDAAGFTASVDAFMWRSWERSDAWQPTSSADEAGLLGFLDRRLLVPSVDAIQWDWTTDIVVMHSWATSRLAGGAPIRIREIAFDGHMTKARITAPIYLDPRDIDDAGLEVDHYYRLEGQSWLPDDGLSFDHGGDDD